MKTHTLAFFFFFFFSSAASACGFFVYEQPRSVTDVVARAQEFYPAGVARPKSEFEAKCALKFARKNGLKVSVKTGGFSQGGQWAIDDGLILDLSEYKGVVIDPLNREVTAMAGTTWEEIQHAAHPHGLAVRVMQSSNIFPIGGSLGINCHGRDIHDGQIVNTVNWIKVLKSNGETVYASAEQNPELFKQVIGGLGLKGIILEANLKLRENKVYETIVLRNVPASEISSVFRLMRSNPSKLKKYVSAKDLSAIVTDMDELTPDMIGLGYARAGGLDSRDKEYLDKALFYLFAEVPEDKISKKAKLALKENESFLERTIMPLLMELQRNFEGAKTAREKLEKLFMRKSGVQANLNYLMNPPVEFLLYKVREMDTSFSARSLRFVRNLVRRISDTPVEGTDVLKEYFIPNNPESVNSFLKTLRKTVKEHNLNLMNITYRVVPKTPNDKAPLLNYAPEEMVAFVLDFYVSMDEGRWERVSRWTKELVQGALNAGGIHYLAYEPQASLEQFLLAYPGALKLFYEVLSQGELNIFMNNYMQGYLEQSVKEGLL